MSINSALRIFTVLEADSANPKVYLQNTSKCLTLVHNIHQYKIGCITENIWNLAQRGWSKHKNHHVISSNGLYGLLTLFILCASPFSVTLLPVNNVMVHPEYWYEFMYSNISLLLFIVITVVTELEVLLNPFNKQTLKVICDVMVTAKTFDILVLCIIHLLWTEVFGYMEPVPFRFAITSSLSLMVVLARLWKLIPLEKRNDPVTWELFKTFLWRRLWGNFIMMQLLVMANVFRNTPRDIQWLIALVVPLTKEINDRVLDNLMAKYSFRDNYVQAKFMVKIATNTAYSFWLAISLATVATKGTGYVLLVINFCINMTLCYKVIRLDKRVRPFDLLTNHGQLLKNEVLTELILNESIEIMVPIAYIVSFLIAYYGPNKNQLGGVGCSIWHTHGVEKLHAIFIPVIQMALCDFGSIFISTACLWWFCRINLLREYCVIIKKYWLYIALFGGAFESTVSII